MEESKLLRKFLECVEDNFLTQLVRESAKDGAWLNLSADPANQGGSSGLEINKRNAHLQEGPEGASGELQTCQPDLGAREGRGTGDLECCHAACAGQPGDLALSAWVCEMQVLLDPPDILL